MTNRLKQLCNDIEFTRAYKKRQLINKEFSINHWQFSDAKILVLQRNHLLIKIMT